MDVNDGRAEMRMLHSRIALYITEIIVLLLLCCALFAPMLPLTYILVQGVVTSFIWYIGLCIYEDVSRMRNIGWSFSKQSCLGS